MGSHQWRRVVFMPTGDNKLNRHDQLQALLESVLLLSILRAQGTLYQLIDGTYRHPYRLPRLVFGKLTPTAAARPNCLFEDRYLL